MSVSSLILRSGVASLAAISFLSVPVSAAYQLDTSYSGSNFFDGFNFFTDRDPTNGFVSYVDQSTAAAKSLISSGANIPAYMGVDSTTYLNETMVGGRTSVRIESKKSFNHGLIISDIAHMPASVCGTWPAHWTLGDGPWPANGEIDIIEGVNLATNNLMSLHTSPGCTIAGANEIGSLQTSDCDTTKNYNSGCGVLASGSGTYGSNFNTNGGGVFATEWTSSYIRIWFFSRASIPADVISGNPNPSTWGLPQANFQGSCNIDEKFKNHRIIFDTTFCGDYSGTLFNLDGSSCKAATGASSCNAYVANNPSAFADAFWKVNSVKVYQDVAVSTSTGVPTATTTTAPLISVTPQSSVLGVGMGGTTRNGTTTSAPYAAGTIASAAASATNPSTVGNFKYFGCAGSSSGFSTFVQVENSPSMSIERCTAACGGYNYAGIFNTLCFCAKTLDSSTSTSAAKGTCSNVCPGNLNQFCGGSVSTPRMVRQASNSILLSVYVNTAAAIVSVAPAGLVFGYGMGGGAAVTATIMTTTYIDVCNVCAGGYKTVTTTISVGHCGCVAGLASNAAYGGLASATPSINMATVTKVCSVCGPNGSPATVTVTVPVTAVPTSTKSVYTTGAITSAPAKFTGAANAFAVNGMAVLAGVAALAVF